MSKEIVVNLGNATLAQKLDCIAALIVAVKDGHRDVISVRSWTALGRAQDNVAEATLHVNDKRGPLLNYCDRKALSP